MRNKCLLWKQVVLRTQEMTGLSEKLEASRHMLLKHARRVVLLRHSLQHAHFFAAIAIERVLERCGKVQILEPMQDTLILCNPFDELHKIFERFLKTFGSASVLERENDLQKACPSLGCQRI